MQSQCTTCLWVLNIDWTSPDTRTIEQRPMSRLTLMRADLVELVHERRSPCTIRRSLRRSETLSLIDVHWQGRTLFATTVKFASGSSRVAAACRPQTWWTCISRPKDRVKVSKRRQGRLSIASFRVYLKTVGMRRLCRHNFRKLRQSGITRMLEQN